MTCDCGRPTSGARLCDTCGRTLAYALVAVADFTDDLENIRAKQTRYGAGSKPSVGKVIPAPIDLRFSSRLESGTRLLDEARATVVAWTKVLIEERPAVAGPWCIGPCLHVSCSQVRERRLPNDTVRSMCLYLDRSHRYIAGQDWAADLLDEMRDLERRLRKFVNPPPERSYAGKCDCGEELYAIAGKPTVTCRECKAEYDVATRRDLLLTAAQDYLVTATEAASALLAWTDYDGSDTKLVDLIRKWRDRDKLDVQDVTSLSGRDRHLYRLGDIQALLVEHAQRRQRQRIGS